MTNAFVGDTFVVAMTRGNINSSAADAEPLVNLPRHLFSPIAIGYDRAAQLLSLYQYRYWHRFLLSRISLPKRNGSAPARVLDMATGTGALALALLDNPNLEVVGADITRTMLLQARTRANHNGVLLHLVECSAEAPPFADNTFDAVVFAYLLRYVADVPSVLAGLTRLLKPGGSLVSLDFAVPRGVLYPLWRLYTDMVLPLAGAVLSPAWYPVGSFLGPSIRGFYRNWPTERLLHIWRHGGFPDVQARYLSLGGALVMWGTKVQ
ncbi:MAG: class I SAM-dependent methyltransferase [Chloroflexi bacterium]|nr:class I SAM-dependent methyltransferase [Chloroflexota bacterium]